MHVKLERNTAKKPLQDSSLIWFGYALFFSYYAQVAKFFRWSIVATEGRAIRCFSHLIPRNRDRSSKSRPIPRNHTSMYRMFHRLSDVISFFSFGLKRFTASQASTSYVLVTSLFSFLSVSLTPRAHE